MSLGLFIGSALSYACLLKGSQPPLHFKVNSHELNPRPGSTESLGPWEPKWDLSLMIDVGEHSPLSNTNPEQFSSGLCSRATGKATSN